MVVAAFVAPYLLEATARFVSVAAELPDVRLGLVTCEPVERIPPDLRERLDAHWRVDDALDPRQLAWAVDGLAGQMGRVDRLVGRPRAAAGAPGAGPRVPRHRGHGRADRDQRARQVADEGDAAGRGHPVRPARARAQRRARPPPSPTRSGSRWSPSRRPARARSRRSGWTTATCSGAGWRPCRWATDSPALLEEFLTGEEHTFDSVTIGGSTVWSSIADYRPPPLEVLRNPWIQWTVAAAPRHHRPAVRGHPPVGTGGAEGAGRHRRAHAHGVVRPARRLGRRLGGGRPAARARS